MAKYSGACIAKDCLKERKSSNIIKIQQNKVKKKNCIKKKTRKTYADNSTNKNPTNT